MLGLLAAATVDIAFEFLSAVFDGFFDGPEPELDALSYRPASRKIAGRILFQEPDEEDARSQFWGPWMLSRSFALSIWNEAGDMLWSVVGRTPLAPSVGWVPSLRRWFHSRWELVVGRVRLVCCVGDLVGAATGEVVMGLFEAFIRSIEEDAGGRRAASAVKAAGQIVLMEPEVDYLRQQRARISKKCFDM
jgi:hypothetical protein